MINILDMNLNSIRTTKTIIINQRDLNNEQVKISISKKTDKIAGEENMYRGVCSADLHLVSEDNTDVLSRDFTVFVEIEGVFTCNDTSEAITSETLNTTIFLELLPHLRTIMSTSMTSVGLAPYYIPNSIIADLS